MLRVPNDMALNVAISPVSNACNFGDWWVPLGDRDSPHKYDPSDSFKHKDWRGNAMHSGCFWNMLNASANDGHAWIKKREQFNVTICVCSCNMLEFRSPCIGRLHVNLVLACCRCLSVQIVALPALASDIRTCERKHGDICHHDGRNWQLHAQNSITPTHDQNHHFAQPKKILFGHFWVQNRGHEFVHVIDAQRRFYYSRTPSGKKDHWKAVDATRGPSTRGKATITIRWQEDEQFRNSQVAHGGTEECCRPRVPQRGDVSWWCAFWRDTGIAASGKKKDKSKESRIRSGSGEPSLAPLGTWMPGRSKTRRSRPRAAKMPVERSPSGRDFHFATP